MSDTNGDAIIETPEIVLPETAEGGSIPELVRKMFLEVGEDPNREGLQ